MTMETVGSQGQVPTKKEAIKRSVLCHTMKLLQIDYKPGIHNSKLAAVPRTGVTLWIQFNEKQKIYKLT